MLSMSSGQVGKCDFRSTLVKYWKMRKLLHLILSMSQLRQFSLGLIIFQPKLTVQTVERGKEWKLEYIHFFSLLIWDWGSEWWQLAPAAPEKPESCLAAGSWGSSAAAVIPTAPLPLVSLTLLSPYSVMKLFCLKVVHIWKYRYSYYAINSL